MSVFRINQRLGIPLPQFEIPFEQLPRNEQENIILEWETIRSTIPDQIIRLEGEIEQLLEKIQQEEDWDVISLHFGQISDYASRINELNIWQRVDPSVATPDQTISNEHLNREK